MNTKQRGDETEATALAELVSRGLSVSIPFGDNDPYDLVVDVDGGLFRLQCKTGWIEESCIRFKTASKTTRDGDVSYVGYDDRIEAFVVVCPDAESLYWVPVEEAGKRSTYLRIEEAEIDHPSINPATEYTLSTKVAELRQG
ncbi:PD-(D/E)XK endonuclease [Halogranum rubrum]|uniref:PD-(D/E)XK endonuclease n=1 Tax=Halogranum rubrum TaxID=553466 RepID=A0A1I4FXU5_9EURY|nr:group I intron-associated PD-(D/E)XK endonuclease [Halogranum rubrum]SFL22708.1 PD-(D/E)XK endonuclease [Halogranum rubrum]